MYEADENGYHDPFTCMKMSQHSVSNEFPFLASIFRCVTYDQNFTDTRKYCDQSMHSSTRLISDFMFSHAA